MGKGCPRLPHLFVALHLLYEVCIHKWCYFPEHVAPPQPQAQSCQAKPIIAKKHNTHAGLQAERPVSPPSCRPCEASARACPALEPVCHRPLLRGGFIRDQYNRSFWIVAPIYHGVQRWMRVLCLAVKMNDACMGPVGVCGYFPCITCPSLSLKHYLHRGA